jgi:hypothetical protein
VSDYYGGKTIAIEFAQNHIVGIKQFADDIPQFVAQIRAAMVAPGQSRGCIWYFETPSPNTTVFSIL